ncbi:hypothetical protein CDO52_08165 [Nocardiopsis gilva YIM 90087]|uniref:Integral membrane protein n=1 Tax=Nocardiopsis gilva YIM 90087 TaxID=1235441 RepID=A0A223S3R1_9ACTN|nr:hypothetical protein [Nocardiopsis gilva]ASU82762.1 hypothetical protein CDO52_08165 [Nocardiopsis gilva YIM 90087]
MSSRPITITLAAVLQALIALVVAAEGCYVLVNTLLGRAFDAAQALPLAVFALVAAAALGYVSWGLYRLNDWARTPVVVTQIFVLVVAYYMWTSEQYAISAALAAVAVAALALVLSPPTTATLFPDNESWQNNKRRQ